jgi:hypothetical protein
MLHSEGTRTMSLSKAMLAAVIGLCAVPGSATADDLPGIDYRQYRQDLRVDQGIAAGSLTAREVARIEARGARLESWEDRALSDGTVTPREQLGLHHAYNHQSRFIFRQKHDGQVR